MSTDGMSPQGDPLTVRADVESVVASMISHYRHDDLGPEPPESITRKVETVGPGSTNSLVTIHVTPQTVTVAAEVQRLSVDPPSYEPSDFYPAPYPGHEPLTLGEPAVPDTTPEFEKYVEAAGRAVALELGLKPETVSDALLNQDSLTFSSTNQRPKGGHLSHKMRYVCVFDSNAFWELDALFKHLSTSETESTGSP